MTPRLEVRFPDSQRRLVKDADPAHRVWGDGRTPAIRRHTGLSLRSPDRSSLFSRQAGLSANLADTPCSSHGLLGLEKDLRLMEDSSGSPSEITTRKRDADDRP